ncbi:DUF4337 family protein [Rhodopila globiformis]|uniref:DUF4337 domain-containing protein n=1 Tax=Rhodopila globiformis TaxID=1071 RepID=A0A2S6NL94_RHOGL|nr:DUF4337 family protein [Rhodopila globiformis]PPQ35900.1 hypothetical protein CCS01_06250 [Rhodopila globiformis]
MQEALEHHEHAEHIAHGHDAHETSGPERRFNQMAALLVAVLAAGLAITEQGAKQAEIRVQQNAIAATDTWAQYQAKSTRGTLSKDLAAVLSVLGSPDPSVMQRRDQLIAQFNQDQDRFENDPKDGKTAIAARARGFEDARDHAMEQTHAYHNGAASMELGIVLSTASAITRARPLLLMALAFGLVGAVFSVLALVDPHLGAL